MERKIREFLADYKMEKINQGLNSLMEEMQNDERYFFMYPLTYLEENAILSNSVISVSNQIDRASISWFLSKIPDKHTFTLKRKFHHTQYEKFKNKFIPQINYLFQEYRQYCEICDHWSYAKSKIEMITQNQWKYTSSLVTNKYDIASFYYNRLFEPWIYEFEMKLRELIELDYYKAALSEMSNIKNYDIKPLMDASLFLIDLDFRFLGEFPISSIIDNIDSFKLFISHLLYLAKIRLSKNSIKYNMLGSLDYDELIIFYQSDELVKVCSEELNIESKVLKKYIDYLTLFDKGSLFEFPLLQLKDTIFFNPSSIILNDWHFSYVNGHYTKDISFIKRDEMISTQVIDIIDDIAKLDKTLLIAREHYYEFAENNKLLKSDIDYAIYDPDKDVMIILECKWKDNHYVSEVDYNNIKIQKSLFEIYNKQISKHKKYIEIHNGMRSLFKNDFKVPRKILYLAIDKRNQLYFLNEKMTSVYMFATLLINSLENEKFNIEHIIDEICSLETKTEYLYFNDSERIIKTDFGVEILTDEL